MARRTAEVVFVGDAKSVVRAAKQAEKSVDGFGRSAQGAAAHSGKMGAALKSLSKTAVLASGGGLFALGAGVKTTFEAFKESQQIARQTDAVLKSTGGTANVTAKQVSNLATAISKKTGIDDEAIQSGENLLLTFTKVRNETGKGNKIFGQATKIVTDMSVALGQDTKSSAIQVGKALNDPIKGVTALQRVGVSFTKSQKDQIKALVDSGKTLDAQKLILKELNTEFGGSAQKTATSGKKLQVTLGNIAETIGSKVSPFIEHAAGVVDRFLNQMVDGAGTGGRFAAAVSTGFARVKAAVESAIPTAISIFDRLKSAMTTVVTSIRGLVQGFQQGKSSSVAIVAGLAAVVSGLVAFKVITTVVKGVKAMRVAMLALNTSMLANPFVLVGAAVVALGVGLVIAYKKSETFRNVVNRAFAGVKSAAKAVASFVGPALGAAFNFAKAAVARVMPGIRQAIKGITKVVRGVVDVVSGIIHGDFGQVWRGVKGIVTGALKAAFGAVRAMTGPAREALSRIGKAALGALKSLPGKMLSFGGDLISGFINGIRSKAGDIINAIKDTITDKLPWYVKKALGISSPSKLFEKFGKWTIEGYVNGLLSAKGKVTAAASASLLYPLDAAIAALEAKKERLQKTWDKIDARAERSSVVKAIQRAKAAPVSTSSGGGGGSSTGGSSSGGRGAGTGVVGGGRFLQGLGLQVGESKYFGGVTTNRHAHYTNDHYSGNSIDVNDPRGGSAELAALQRALVKLREKFRGQIQQAMIEDAGTANQHLHVTFKSAGKAAKAATAKVAKTVAKAAANVRGAVTPTSWAKSLLASLGMGASKGRLQALVGWTKAEGGHWNNSAKFNPLNTTLRMPGSHSMNSVGVQSFKSWQQGLEATIKTLKNGHYGKILGALRSGNPIAVAQAIGATPWGTNAALAMSAIRGAKVGGGGSLVSGGVSAKKQAAIQGQIDANNDRLDKLREEKRNLGTGKAAAKRRKELANEIALIGTRNRKLREELGGVKATDTRAQKIREAMKALKDFDKAAGRTKKLANFDVKIGNLERLKAFRDAIKGIGDNLKDMASQAASVWRDAQEKAIDAAASIKTKGIEDAFKQAMDNVASSPEAKRLAELQGTDKTEQDTRTERDLNQGVEDAKQAVADAQYLSDHSGGKTHQDALKQLEKAKQDYEDAQADLTRFHRQQEEEHLQDSIDKATEAATTTRDTALDGVEKETQDKKDALDQQTTDFEAGLNAQFEILVAQLEQRKITYAEWAKQVNAILSAYGLSAETDAGTEAAVNSGPGPAAGGPPRPGSSWGGYGTYGWGASKPKKKKKAVGGWVYPGTTYMVGELGPEPFTPAVPGRITQASQAKGGSGNTVNFNGDINIRNEADMTKLSRKVGWAIRN